MYKIGRDVEIADATAERATVSVIGPGRAWELHRRQPADA